MWYNRLLEKDLLPESLIRLGIRGLLWKRLKEEDRGDPETDREHLMSLVKELNHSPIAINTEAVNSQHYGLPADFFSLILGKYKKYSSAYWKKEVTQLDDAEVDMLEITCRRSELTDGQKILELGCGWGSLSLYMAEKYPGATIKAITNSISQKEYIDKEAKARSLHNLKVVVCDMNNFQPDGAYDRVISVEMFEHIRNYYELMKKISETLLPDGKLFVHIFVHKRFAYKFEVKDSSDWISKYFFTGGIMPSDDLLLHFQNHLKIEQQWRVSGTHYQKTAEAWLHNMKRNKTRIMEHLSAIYGNAQAQKWWVYWKVFFMSCAELWGYDKGREWFVSHYLFRKLPQL